MSKQKLNDLISKEEVLKQQFTFVDESGIGLSYYNVVGVSNIQKIPTVNAIIVPEGASNLDVLKAAFPNIEITYSKDDVENASHVVMVHGLDGVTSLTADWANASYEMEEPEAEMEEERE